MEFRQAFEALKQGKKIRRQHWAGYWELVENNSIVMFCKDGRRVPLKENEDDLFTIGNTVEDDWTVVDEADTKCENTIHTFTFGEAIRKLKQGKKVARQGWNGKGMYLFLLPASVVKKEWVHDPALLEAFGDRDEMECLGSIRMFTADKKILTGWLASQTDILSEDWTLVE